MQKVLFTFLFVFAFYTIHAQEQLRLPFNEGWKFYLTDSTNKNDDYKNANYNDASWRQLNLPHDWSIEGEFKKENPATPEGGALPGGVGWYRKIFTVNQAQTNKKFFIDFDGVYRCSDVWVNGHHLGFRPSGYISFRYDITPYLNPGNAKNVIAVKVDNSRQPNSRWYSGSGIYRNVWLVTTDKIAVDHWGTFVTTPTVTTQKASVNIKTKLRNYGGAATVNLQTNILDASGKVVATQSSNNLSLRDSVTESEQQFKITSPTLWSIDKPYVYKAVTRVIQNGKTIDEYQTTFGVRYFNFDVDKGFSLNGKHVKINGVCNHHDLGALGAAINVRALERQLELLRGMGVNAIRTSHNPPAPELLDLCDKMGFLVMDEAFDMWKRSKTKYDYSNYWDEWHKQDLQDQILRDRNHPCVIIWSIGNEIGEQRTPAGTTIARELASIVHSLDTTRPITTANNNPDTGNYIIKSGALDLIGYNYHHNDLAHFHERYPGKKFIATETVSSLATRGYYQMPSDSIRRWPGRRVVNGQRVPDPMNTDNTVSAYDNVSAPWGSTQEETWKVIKKYEFLSGQFIWTGFDYLGEPTPYSWPSRSSYFGIIDLAGFPKDTYYMYQSEWTNKTVLHIFPHWNWKQRDTVDIWAYYNNADEVELFLNNKSLGVRKKQGDDLHVMWRVNYVPGTLRAVSRKNGKEVLTKEIHTAGAPAKIQLTADRSKIKADGKDLSFITAKVLDKDGNVVPDAENLIQFKVDGEAFIASVDNGNPVSHEPFEANYRKAFNGLALAILQAKQKAGKVTFTATSEGLQPQSITVELQK
jgi:beta-galactosidase